MTRATSKRKAPAESGVYYLDRSGEPIGPFASDIAAIRAANGPELAFDRSSARSYDSDGRMHVEPNPISKANICPYLGREIPKWRELGLDPTRIYQMLRDPEELKKAAPTFNNLPLLSKHVPVTVDKFPRDLIVGSTGTDADFDGTYLNNSLVIWTKEGIEGVEDDSQKELSSSYRYRADMTPGNFSGSPYDGVMRDIKGNHVALVPSGRAGVDVVVGDCALPKLNEVIEMRTQKGLLSRKAAMVQGAIIHYLAPKLAMDAKVDLTPAFKGLTPKNFSKSKAKLVAAIEKACEGKLANDADISDIVDLLDVLEDVKPLEAADTETAASSATPLKKSEAGEDEEMDDEEAEDEDPMAKGREFLKSKLNAEDMKAFDELCPAGGKKAMDAEEDEDETEEERKKRMAKDKAARDALPTAGKPEKVTKPAMDAALAAQKKSILAEQREIREAEKAVRPLVGDLELAFDSASEVYGAALEHLGVDTDGVPATGYRALFGAIASQRAQTAQRRQRDPELAMDSKGVSAFNERFPGADRIGRA